MLSLSTLSRISPRISKIVRSCWLFVTKEPGVKVTGEEKNEVPKMVWETKNQIPMDGKLDKKDSVFIRRKVSFDTIPEDSVCDEATSLDEQEDALAKRGS